MAIRTRFVLLLWLVGCRSGSGEPTTTPDDVTAGGAPEGDEGGMPDDEPAEEEDPY